MSDPDYRTHNPIMPMAMAKAPPSRAWSPLIIRKATIEDLAAITEIYNDAILKTVATFDPEPKSLEEQKLWFANHSNRYPILVAEWQRGVSESMV